MEIATEGDISARERLAVKKTLLGDKIEFREMRIPFVPRECQRWMFSVMDKNQNSVVVAHRRMGKTRGLCSYMLGKALKNDRALRDPAAPPIYALVSPTERQSMSNVWGYLRELTSLLDGTIYRKSERKIILPNKAEIYVMGATQPDLLRGRYLDGVILDEFAFMSGSSIWNAVISPMLLDYNGFAVFSSTPAGRNFFYRLYKDAGQKKGWGSIILPIDKTRLYSEQEIAEFLERQSIPEYEKQQEYYCSFDAPVSGTYYGEILRGLYHRDRVGDFPYNPNYNIFTGWDIGINDNTSIWFAQQNRATKRWQIIDYECGMGLSANEWARIVQAKNYNYVGHILPFDAEYKDRGSGVTYKNYLYEAGLRNIIIAGKKPKDTTVVLRQIENTRQFLLNCDFNINYMVSGFPKCPVGIRTGKPRDQENGLDALTLYRADYDEAKQKFGDKPRHDWTSHAADAMRYMALVLNPMMKTGNDIDSMVEKQEMDPIKREMKFWLDEDAGDVAHMDTGGII